MTKPVNEVALLGALEVAVLERSTTGAMSLVGMPPSWFSDLLGPGKPHFTPHDLLLRSPFLADFIQEADNAWNNSGTILASGSWSQRNLKGEEAAFEAWALRSGHRDFLLVRFLVDFEDRRRAFQKAREMELSQEWLGRRHRELSEVKDALEIRNREVERVNQLKSEFLASMSHELRTPLNAILGFSTLLEEQKAGPLNTEQTSYVHHVAKASRHLLALINEILDLSKIEAGHLELDPECIEFSEVLTEVLSTIRPLARGKNISIAIRLLEGITIYADRLRFKQILYNLLSNAIKFTPDFGEVSIDCSKEGSSAVAISVTDNGIGIPEEEREAIFEKFHQVHGLPGEAKEGTGLGLAITRRLVEAHGGKIWLADAPGPGTRFSFTLPRQPDSEVSSSNEWTVQSASGSTVLP